MDARDIIITALTPGTVFNVNNKVWRSVSTLAAFCHLEVGDVMQLLAGDLAHIVYCKPSSKGRGVLVAIKENVEPPAPAAEEQLVVMGGPAMNAPVDPEPAHQMENGVGVAEPDPDFQDDEEEVDL